MGMMVKAVKYSSSILYSFKNIMNVKKDVNVYNEISWKYGVFNFNGKPLKEIMKTISRWYDVQIIFLDKKIEETEFVGVIRKNRNLEDILINIKNLRLVFIYLAKYSNQSL